MKAIWNKELLAQSDDTLVIEGNHYFPKDSIKSKLFINSPTKTTCPWKGEASYYSLSVNGLLNKDAAWYYPNPKEAARDIKDRVAFWKGVSIEA